MTLIDKEIIRKEIKRRIKIYGDSHAGDATQYDSRKVRALVGLLEFLDTLPEQPMTDHHEIEMEFRGEKVTVNREFYRDGERNYSTSEQDDNAIWSALRAWCEKKGITPFELYPKQPDPPVEGLEEAADKYAERLTTEPYLQVVHKTDFIAGAEWQKAQDQKTIELAEDHAMLAGMNKMEQQMMEKAVETQILTTSFINLPKEYLHQNSIQAGDKVRVIVIKEDEK